LRRVRLEASKAQRFQEYTTRLRELRIGVGLREFGQFTERFLEESTALESLRSVLGEAQIQAASAEAEAKDLEVALSELETTLEQSSGKLADIRQQLATRGAQFESESATANDLEGQLAETRSRRVELSRLVRVASASASDAGDELRNANLQADSQRRRVAELETALSSVDAELTALHLQVQEDRRSQADLVRQAITLQSQAESAKTQLERFYRDRESRRRHAEQKVAELDTLQRVLEDLNRTGADLQHRLGIVRNSLAQRLQERDDLRKQAEAKQQELAELNVRRGDLRGRIDVLEGLERSQEGLGTGVKEVMAILAQERKSRSTKGGLSATIVGFVADFLSVPRDVAPLIDLVLGDTAQKFVVRDSERLDRLLAARKEPLSGRVSFLPLLDIDPLEQGDETSTADRWVTCDDPELAGLPRQLLGNVRIVPDLATARVLALDPEFQGFRFITKKGELLDTDGTLTVGTHHAEAGILSRKSELRELRAQAAAVDKEITAAERAIAKLRGQIEALDAPIHGLEQEIELLSNQAGDLNSRILQDRQNHARINEELTVHKTMTKVLEDEINSLEATWKDSRERAEEAERSAHALKNRLEDADHRIQTHDRDRVQRREDYTASQVSLAKMEERLTGLRARFEQIESDLRRGSEESHRVERHEGVLQARFVECQLTVLQTSAEVALLHHFKENHDREIAQMSVRRDLDRERRRVLVDQLQSVRAASKDQLDQLHRRELSVRDLENSRNSLVERLREDYQIDLAAEYERTQPPRPVEGEESPGAPPAMEDIQAVNTEIGQLKEKIRKLGNVSLESLQELQEVEKRSKELQAQHDDLMSAQGSLMEIIAKINADSRKLFTETYENIRTHFQDLFRKLFGGGMADIVLENPEDVLESGIEIVARPPGKELRSISLMSGGEKTLTAVALLLAIFRSKPSPFCLLDEVDAALDEANTTRLANVLREFLDNSQFIIITHKKRTMAMADVLYGITMQESGVSKQVAVRFEDWPEDEGESETSAA
jgi:chromosome segregation protein